MEVGPVTRSVSNDRGFTLAELMVVLFLAAVAAVIAERFMGNWYKAYEFSGFVRAIDTALMTARGRAIATQKPVRLILTAWNQSDWDNAGNSTAIKALGSTDFALKNDTRDTDTPSTPSPWNNTGTKDFYRLVLLWSNKQWKVSEPYYEIQVHIPSDPDCPTPPPPRPVVTGDPSNETNPNQIWFDARGFAILSSDTPTRTQFKVCVNGNAAGREQTFIVTPMGKVRIRREAVE